MKRQILIFAIFSIGFINANGQGPWSISIAYAPRIEHRGPYIRNLFYYPVSPGIIADLKITNRISLSSGLLFHYETDENYSGSPHIRYTYKTYLFEVPLQTNYHLYAQTRKFDPFLKSSFRYTHFSLVLKREQTADIIKNQYDDYYFLLDFGAGLNLKIQDNIIFRLQLSYGLGIKHEYKNFRYFEPMISFGYKLN